MIRILICFLIYHLQLGQALAFIPEGLETMSLYKSSPKKSHIYANFQSVESVWRSEGNSLVTLIDYQTDSKDLVTLGYYQTTSKDDKFAYFFRYDLIFWGTQSISLKYLHNEWNYISTTQENLALEYNGFVPWGSGRTNFFYTLGLYGRWLKQKWNNDYQNPLSFQTDDKSVFATLAAGLLIEFGTNGSFVTVDFNNRDFFNFHNADNFATDVSFYFAFQKSLTLKIFAGTRWSTSFTYIPGFPATNYVGLGVIY